MSIPWKHIIVALLWLSACCVWAASDSAEPDESQSFLLTDSDVKDFSTLIARLRDGMDPVSEFLRSQCSQRTVTLLYSYRSGSVPSDEIRKLLLSDLNSVMERGALYEKERFAQVQLSAETLALIDRSPTGQQLARLNRMLLEQAYPKELAEKEEKPIDVQAHSLEYDKEKGVAVGHGQVVLRRGDVLLRSELAIVNIETYDVYAEGDVFFEHGSQTWSGDKLRYNFKTNKGDFGEFISFITPFYVRAADSSQIAENKYLFHNALVTTCEGDSPIAYLRSPRIEMETGRHAKGRHVLLYIGGVPVLYTPYWKQNIGSPNFFSAVPGYSSRMSAFLLTAFNYRLSRHFETATHLDYRVKRGPGVGQDIMWSSSGNAKELSTERYMKEEDDFWYLGRKAKSTDIEEQDEWFGDLIAYYTQDSWPDEGDEQLYPLNDDRYRLRFYHNHNIDENRYFLAQMDYLSDPKIVEQFFSDEYDHAPEPENYLVLGHRSDKFSASLEIDKRMNDFYTFVERLPAASIDFTRQQLGDTSFYYDGKTEAGYLRKEWEEAETNEADYSSFRFDTDNKLYYSMRWFDFLNVTPRVGYRGTFYSSTTEDAEQADADGFPRELGSEMRSVGELGLESSFKAFKVWEAHPGGVIHNLRHIAEPYVNYTFIPEPNVLAENLYQFDAADNIGESHNIKLGMINKLQTKTEDSLVELINADIWTYYKLETEHDEDSFSNICFNIRSLMPHDRMTLLFDGEFDQYDSSFEIFNARLIVEGASIWKNELEYRYRRDSNSLLYDQFSFRPFANWRFNMYARHEFEDNELEALGLSVEKVIECLTVRVAGEMEDDDYQFWVQFWFTEFPKARVGLGG